MPLNILKIHISMICKLNTFNINLDLEDVVRLQCIFKLYFLWDFRQLRIDAIYPTAGKVSHVLYMAFI